MSLQRNSSEKRPPHTAGGFIWTIQCCLGEKNNGYYYLFIVFIANARPKYQIEIVGEGYSAR